MPASERSVQLTDAYRQRLVTLRDRAESLAQDRWRRVAVGALEQTFRPWAQQVEAAVRVIQTSGVVLSAAYLAAYVASERGERPESPTPDLSSVGRAQHGAPLDEALQSPLIGVLAALKNGDDPEDAMRAGWLRAQRLVTSAAVSAPRETLARAIEADERIVGWRRVTHGGCGACLAQTGPVFDPGEKLHVHDHCQCTAEPVVTDAQELHPRPTGPEVFAGMSRVEQDHALGTQAAQAVREGRVAWHELVAFSPMAEGDPMLTQAPLEALA